MHHCIYVLDTLINHFLCSPAPLDPITGLRRPKQVLSLGAGSDSQFWKFTQHWKDHWAIQMWVETNFGECTTVKAKKILADDRLLSDCGQLLKPLDYFSPFLPWPCFYIDIFLFGRGRGYNQFIHRTLWSNCIWPFQTNTNPTTWPKFIYPYPNQTCTCLFTALRFWDLPQEHYW